MTLAVHHIALNAADPERLAALYHAAAGYDAVARDGGTQWIALPNAFVAIEPARRAIGAAEAARRVCDQGITHFCVQSGDGRQLWHDWTAAGLAFNAPPVGLRTGAIYAYGRDPEANVIEAEGVAAAPGLTPWMAHVALATADLDRLASFYATLIGRPPHHRDTYANPLFEQITGLADVSVSAAWIMTDNLIFEMWQYHHPATLPAPPLGDGEPGYARIGFACADLGAEAERLRSAGVRLVDGPQIGGLASLEGRDPDGNRFVVVEEPAPPHPLALASLAAPRCVTDRNLHLLVQRAQERMP